MQAPALKIFSTVTPIASLKIPSIARRSYQLRVVYFPNSKMTLIIQFDFWSVLPLKPVNGTESEEGIATKIVACIPSPLYGLQI